MGVGMEKLFYELVQVALGAREKLSKNPSESEWMSIYIMAQEQSVVGVLFTSLDKLSLSGQKPPLSILYDWIGLAEQIKQRNILLNKRCVDLMRFFEDVGYKSCILKGQGNALMYPNPLLRQAGDIDIWVKGKLDDIIDFCRSKASGCKMSHHHIQFPIWEDVDVEVHFMPSYTRVPRYMKRTRAYFEKFQREEVKERGMMPELNKMYVPSKEMNLVFQMSHLARHFFYSGIGLKQILDYYYLLKYIKGKVNTGAVVDDLRNVGLYKFAGAVMWVLKVVFAARDEMLIVPVDEKRGKLVLDEILKGGNFGKYNQRLSGKLMKKSATTSIIIRNMRMLRLFPEEVIWVPIMGLWCHLKYKES